MSPTSLSAQMGGLFLDVTNALIHYGKAYTNYNSRTAVTLTNHGHTLENAYFESTRAQRSAHEELALQTHQPDTSLLDDFHAACLQHPFFGPVLRANPTQRLHLNIQRKYAQLTIGDLGHAQMRYPDTPIAAMHDLFVQTTTDARITDDHIVVTHKNGNPQIMGGGRLHRDTISTFCQTRNVEPPHIQLWRDIEEHTPVTDGVVLAYSDTSLSHMFSNGTREQIQNWIARVNDNKPGAFRLAQPTQ